VNLLTCVHTLPSGPGLRLAPFPGVRYSPGKVSDIADVTSPPYDVIGTGIREHLLSADPHNVVRLILPDPGPGDCEPWADTAAARLRDWLSAGVLARDPSPGIYLYEQLAGDVLQRGLVALIGVGPDAGILPHEDVMPGPVAGRLELMAATKANLEPIFLVYDGKEEVAAFIERVADERPALVTADIEDGSRHRLWLITDPAEVALITGGLAGRQALIADGHHRYAAYTQLASRMHAAGRGAGPWDYGLAFLVDSAAYPPHIGAVHRVLPGLRARHAAALAESAFTVRPLSGGLPTVLSVLGGAGPGSFVLAGEGTFWLLTSPDPEQVRDAMPPGTSPRWRNLDAAILRDLLLDRLWGLKDNERNVQVLHDPAETVAAVASGGTAVLCNPISFPVVRDIAGHGERVPRKSTSFTPKPRTGLVLRTF
jgi:uncharacterized protein (DUF1015 family)